jgi:hypothetical protein
LLTPAAIGWLADVTSLTVGLVASALLSLPLIAIVMALPQPRESQPNGPIGIQPFGWRFPSPVLHPPIEPTAACESTAAPPPGVNLEVQVGRRRVAVFPMKPMISTALTVSPTISPCVKSSSCA